MELPKKGTRARCSGCTKTRVMSARGLCHHCYHDQKLRAHAPMRHGFQKWTPEEEKTLVRLRKKKLSVKEIAKILGRTKTQIVNKSNHMRLRPGQYGPPKQPKPKKIYTGRRCFGCNRRQLTRTRNDWYSRGSDTYCPSCWQDEVIFTRPVPVRVDYVGVEGPRVYKEPQCA